MAVCMPHDLCRGTQYFQYQKVLQTCCGISVKLTKKFLSEKFSSSSWLYSKNLVGHTGCVNALAFSNNGGEFLVSGGDDTKVLVWSLHEAVQGNTTARCLKQQHHSNIFCVTFDNDNRHILTAGNDEVILQHDFESGEVVRRFEAEAETNEICIHPEDNNIFIAAESSYGAVTLFDARTPTEQLILAVPWPVKTKLSECWPKKSNFSSAKFNPIDPTFIATGNLRNGVQLWDTRCPKRCLKHFDPEAQEQCVMSVAFDQTGRYIAAVRKSLPPVLYHIDRDTCLMKFYEKGYSNTVTRKSVCFAGLTDEFIVTGSEDFKVYLWAVPNLRKDHNGVAKVEHSALALEGHRSIVNQVCFNQDTAMLCTSGVEKIIKMWSPFPMVGGISGDTRCDKRKLYTRADYLRLMNNDEMNLFEDSTSEDQQMLAMVDQWLQTNYSSSDDESDELTGNYGIAAEQVGRENLSVQFSLFHEISDSPNSTDSNSEISESPERNSVNSDRDSRNTANSSNSDFENDNLCQAVSENAGWSGRNSDNAGSLDRYSRNTGGPDRNCESAESSNSNFERSEGIGLERLHEIISSQSRPRSTLERIAQLRRNVLRNNENVSMFPKD